MYRNGDIIGRIVGRGPGSFLWEIPGFSGLPKEAGDYFLSPDIPLAAGTPCNLYVYPNGTREFPDRILLELCRSAMGPARTFHCTVGVRRADGAGEEAVGSHTAKIRYLDSVIHQFDRGAKDCREGDWLASGTLTFALCVRVEGEAAPLVPPPPPTSRATARNGDVIGLIFKGGRDTFLWEIAGFPSLPRQEGVRFLSPYVDKSGTKWRLVLYPNGTKDFPHWMLLDVWRCDDGPAFRCALGVQRADGGEVPLGQQTVKLGDGYAGYVLFPFYKRAEECGEGGILSSGTLTLTLRLRDEREAVSQGPPCKKSRKRKAGNSDVESGCQENEVKSNDCSCPRAKGVVLLTKHMEDLLEKSDDCDMKFRVQDKEFPAHRNILKARCPVFRMMLTHDTQENQSGIIRIEDCDADAFGVFLVYVYSGKTEGLTPQKALNLYYIADKYDFPELKEECVALLKGSLSKTTVCDVVLLSSKHGESELMKMATNFFVQNIKEIVVTAEWKTFMIEHPIEGNELYLKYLNLS